MAPGCATRCVSRRPPLTESTPPCPILHDVNVWPHGSRQNLEADLQAALKYGVAHGAKAIGTALQIAKADGEASAELG